MRDDTDEHSDKLREDSTRSLDLARERRSELGIDPSRLLVLQLTFLGANLREHLENRLGLRIVEERKIETDLESRHYQLTITFESPEDLRSFSEREDLDQLGLIGTEPFRESSGDASSTRLTAKFPDRQSAISFRDSPTIKREANIESVTRSPRAFSRSVSYRIVIQFPDEEAIRAFEEELYLYRNGVEEAGRLTYIQRRELFDALDVIELVSPDDKKGGRLREEEVPDGTFFFDVDLWHPGTEAGVREADTQLRRIAENSGGEVTDIRGVADSLLLARIRGNADTLDEMLQYDQVARVDLPPVFAEPEFDLFDPVSLPEELPDPTDEMALACVVDSGIISGHPLLAGLIVDSNNIHSGEPDEFDNVGHGTHVAGIVAYGDVRKCAEEAKWTPNVRLLNAKVMKKGPRDNAIFADTMRVEGQIEEAIKWGVEEYDCRVFNLSFGNIDYPYNGGRQQPWAMLLDELARIYNVVIVVSAGNVSDPEVPAVPTSDQFQNATLENVTSDVHNIVDPGCAINALTVGSIARTEAPHRTTRRHSGDVTPLVAVPQGCPSPFTRTGSVSTRGQGLHRTLKPELVAYGGNYVLSQIGDRWKKNDPNLGEPSCAHDYADSGRLLKVMCGTSVAAPYVTHICASVEKTLEENYDDGELPSANLIRALVVHSAEVNDEIKAWITEDGRSETEAEKLRLQAVGYGMPDLERACYSSDNRVVLIAEDEIPDDHVHVYNLELPDDFKNTNDLRRIRITLAYDPPIRDTRKEYLQRRLRFRLYRGVDSATVFDDLSPGGNANVLPRNKADARPTLQRIQWSTVQSAVFERPTNRSFDYEPWQIGVSSLSVFAEAAESQRYALVVSLEHESEQVEIYQDVRQWLAQRVRVRG